VLKIVRSAEANARRKTLALAHFLDHLRMMKKVRPAAQLALVEAALRIADGHRTEPWHGELSSLYLKLRESETTAAWRQAFSLDQDEVLQHCEAIRNLRHYPPFVPPIPRRALPAATTPALPVGVKSKIKITRVDLNGFRAASAPIGLDLTTRGKPGSVVIFGDNGVGKSTLVTAIELACQGTVGRQAPGWAGDGPQLINLATPGRRAEVSVTLTDNTTLSKTIERGDGMWRTSGSVTPFAFSLAPILLQRADLVRFLGTPGARRGQLFVGQFAAGGTDGSVQEIQQRERTAKAARKQFVDDLAGRAGHPARVGTEFVLAMLGTLYLGGQSEGQWKAHRGRLPREYVADKNRYLQLDREINAAKDLTKQVPKEELENHALQVKRLGELLGDVNAPLTAALVAVTRYEFVERLAVTVGGSVALGLRMVVHLKDGTTVAPEQIFSEGAQDLLAILFFIEVAKAAAVRGQAKVLILDDVIQSVDATIRRRLLQHILTDLKDWQLIITCHDRLWLGHVQEALRNENIPYCDVEIRSWDFTDGPVISSTGTDPSADLRTLVRKATPRTVAGAAGLLLETLCNTLSWTLPASVPRARDDRYTLQTLWDSVKSKVKNSPELGPQFNEISKIISLRNQLGAHYNEVADSIADAEADRFGDLVLKLWASVYCGTCCGYVAKQAPKIYSCRCGVVQFTT
jgi:hypothetical protein